jgi:DNA-binding response OmpR family regulator
VRILFAEDDRQLRESVARGLREASYVVDQAADGVQASELAEANDYDAIILDILMPRQDGIAACRAIRAGGSRAPILMLTALDAVEDKIAGLDAGADDYLTKPFDFGELLARLRALTRRQAEVLPSELAVGDLVIDTGQRVARRGDREIALTSKEFAFLEYLARHPGRVVSRDELMAHVWEDSRSSYSNIIDVYASRLRRKIDDGEDVALFVTHRAVGYMLRTPDVRSATRNSSREQPERRPTRPPASRRKS